MRPAVSVLDNGDIMLQVYSGNDPVSDEVVMQAYLSKDFGETWELMGVNTSPLTILPAGHVWSATDETQGVSYGDQLRKTVSSIAYGGGRVFTIAQNADGATEGNSFSIFDIYDWILLGSQQTIQSGLPQWCGVDDLRFVFSGTPVVQDRWDIDLRYRYDARNLAVESPSIGYRSVDDTQNVTFEWDRDHADAVAALGAGKRWNVDAFSLFGTNFETCEIHISDPDYSGASYPATTQETRFSLSAVVDVGVLSEQGLLDGTIRDNSKSWAPHQFKPGLRNYYVKIADQGTPPVGEEMYRILDNTENTLVLEQDMGVLLGIGASLFNYKIISDRFFSDGTGGERDTQAHQPAILNTPYANPKFIRLVIPAQTTAEGYFKVGTTIFGTQTPLVKTVGHGTIPRNRFSRGFGWQPRANTGREVGRSGVASQKKFGRTGQAWVLSYENLLWWDRDYIINGIVSDPERAFVFIFDNKNLNSMALVTASNLPNVVNTSGDRYNFTMEIEEVI